MNSNTILNWNNVDHKVIYARQLHENPIYWNPDLNTWVIYSYSYCKAILTSDNVSVPEPVIDSLLNDKVKLIISKLARITNNMQHQESRAAAMIVFQCIKHVPVAELMEGLLANISLISFDWVDIMAKKLPVLIILRGVGFNDDECAFVTENISILVRIMSPNKTTDDITAINAIVNRFYTIAENYVNVKFIKHDKASIELFTVNLLGLFIQSYDAGRGLLCNSLINLLAHHSNKEMQLADSSYFKRSVIETLRLDSPVHNTRRIAAKDFMLGDQLIKTGDPIMIILAAANLDPVVFNQPEKYDPIRSNNVEHLTFGLGGHNCLAKYYIIDMVTDACYYLVNKYPNISMLQQNFTYEELQNVRLVKELIVKIS